MDKIIKKSFKICVALLIGFILGYGLSRIIEEKDENKDSESCSCES